MLLGTGFGGESLSLIEWLALAVIIFAVVLVTLGKYLFPSAARLLLVRRRSSRQFADPLRIDLRVVSGAADPLFQTFGERRITQPEAPRRAHSQMINTRQPSSASFCRSRASRATLPAILSSQNAVRVAGTLNR